jgi:hypothetical protein
MEKKYHFLAGFPRSGNTLLSALLNQNPEIYSTPLSPVPGFMWEIIDSANNSEQVNRNIENQILVKKFLSSFVQNYYKSIEKPVIIERQQGWSTPGNLDIIKEHITKTPKIIFTVRDILEIIASFINLDANYLKNESYSQDYYMAHYLSEKDLIAEHIMKTNGSSLTYSSTKKYLDNLDIARAEFADASSTDQKTAIAERWQQYVENTFLATSVSFANWYTRYLNDGRDLNEGSRVLESGG